MQTIRDLTISPPKKPTRTRRRPVGLHVPGTQVLARLSSVGDAEDGGLYLGDEGKGEMIYFV